MPDDFEERKASGIEAAYSPHDKSTTGQRVTNLPSEETKSSPPHYLTQGEAAGEISSVYGSSSDPYGYPSEPPVSSIDHEPIEPEQANTTTPTNGNQPASVVSAPLMQRTPAAPPPPPPPPSSDEDDEGDDEERGMLRMSFMGHLEELRSRILYILFGIVIAFLASFTFTDQLWHFVQAPATGALKNLGVNPPKLAVLTPMEGFSVIWIKLPLLVAVFLASPWVLYQVWAFISPGLYKREKRWAIPFITCTAGLFIGGGCFAYFVAFRYGIQFLLGIGITEGVTPVISISEYFDLFVNVILGVALVFEMPVVIFFLTLLRLASPRFLLRHSRYAILGIVVLAAIVTPTPDIFNMMIFAIPMVLLYFVGVFASFLLVIKREGKKFPWRMIILAILGLLSLVAAIIAILIYHYHFHAIPKWPYLIK